jgi:hypothetical protein
MTYKIFVTEGFIDDITDAMQFISEVDKNPAKLIPLEEFELSL